MGKGRLEAFSDGVIAIIITIMVLELHAPHSQSLQAMRPLIPALLSYALSFIFVGIYWNNHHHLLHAAQRVNGSVLWANLNLLFWLSLIPFATNWIGESQFGTWSVALYGGVLLMAGVAYSILSRALIAIHGSGSILAAAVGRDVKGKISLLLYVIGITGSFINAWIGLAIYVVVAILWLIPDRRISRHLAREINRTP